MMNLYYLSPKRAVQKMVGFQEAVSLLEPHHECYETAQLMGTITKRPYTTNKANIRSTTLAPMLEYSPRRPWVIIAPTIVNAKPAAATGVSQGKMPVTAGRISPMAPSISKDPIKGTPLGPTSFTHSILVSSLSIGCVTFMIPAIANARASRICTIQSAMFIVHFSLEKYSLEFWLHRE